MKRTKLIFAVLAAVAGIGSAYASTSKVASTDNVYRWHTAMGATIFTANTSIGIARCIPGIDYTCMYGTRFGQILIRIMGELQE